MLICLQRCCRSHVFACSLCCLGDPISVDLNRQNEWDEAIRLHFYNHENELMLHGRSLIIPSIPLQIHTCPCLFTFTQFLRVNLQILDNSVTERTVSVYSLTPLHHPHTHLTQISHTLHKSHIFTHLQCVSIIVAVHGAGRKCDVSMDIRLLPRDFKQLSVRNVRTGYGALAVKVTGVSRAR